MSRLGSLVESRLVLSIVQFDTLISMNNISKANTIKTSASTDRRWQWVKLVGKELLPMLAGIGNVSLKGLVCRFER